jgi:acyl-CoA synthetase (AMP-forming)/AMP-acid ligase II
LPRDPQTATGGTIVDLLRGLDAAPALVTPASGDVTTYGELRATVERVAGQLAGAGVEPGDAVALASANDPAFMATFLAIALIGAAAAPLNPSYTAVEFHSYLEDLRPKCMIFRDGAGAKAREVCAVLGIGALELAGARGRETSLADLAASDSWLTAGPDSIALLLHTSGTTSRPKGVPLRQRNLVASADAVAAAYGLTSDDVSHCVMPLFHVHGLVASVLATLSTGGTVLVPPRFSASAFWGDSARHRATWFSAVPTIHHVLVTQGGDGPKAAPLRFARSCSSALAPTTWRQCEDFYGTPVVEAYGMTEAAHQMTSNPLPPGDRRPGSVGRSTGVDVAVVDDDWSQLPAGEAGEVVVRGPSVVDGYRSNPEADAASFRDRWFRTGDIGHLSPDGYLSLHGRIKELINRGGEKISPHEIEDALLSHPAVLEAVAFPEPDAKYGERVGAAAVLRTTTQAAELLAHCAERLADFKVPTKIVVVDQIPKGPTGKIQRRRLGEQLSG